MSDLTFTCKVCKQRVNPIWLCDEVDGEYCSEHFEAATHCDRDHGEGCATLVHEG